ncbi:PD40 domain-containing protein [Sphingosinicella sp. CPCC 101087]|uniref:PD40 domain-containing protein n=1 Tax=Sphingosinicella sp. CPCC 101087 TaxID=2497754 RepID=UPI00101BC30C|nr:PD40 domain-containing protein [Sphingosinicella sp. CPCC 101087]
MKAANMEKRLAGIAAAAAMLAATEAGAAGRAPEAWTPDAISTEGYESSPAFMPDGREIYYVAADANFRGWRIMRSRCDRGAWSAPEEASFSAPAPTIEADPFITSDGGRIYFVSARHDPANADFDIYRAERRQDGSWSEPVRLPEPVNSPASELLPRVDGSGRLYFGSARAGGFGQSDIYVADERAPGEWSVENVGPPVSTGANEYEAEISQDGSRLVVVADRGDRSHLYTFERRPRGWVETGRVAGRLDVFQVGPLLSPRGEWLLFSQAHAARSGEMFLVPLVDRPTERWPPGCREDSPGAAATSDEPS